MYVKVIHPKTHGKKKYTNSGSSAAVVNYLKKEDEVKGDAKELYFNHDKDKIDGKDVIRSIDSNCPRIEKKEAKFYSLVVAPRPDEIERIKNDKKILKEYVRDTMDIYAQNFNNRDGTSKNLTAKDIVYYAKIEDNRYYRGTDEAVKKGKAKQGDVMPGINTHVHIIVSRQDKKKKLKLSPLANSKKIFSREAFKLKSCKCFDEKHKYTKDAARELVRYIIIRDGTVEQRRELYKKEYAIKRALRQQNEVQMQEQKQHVKQEIKPQQKPEIKQEPAKEIKQQPAEEIKQQPQQKPEEPPHESRGFKMGM